MIANARMYAVGPRAADNWRRLFLRLIARSGAAVDVVDHPPPAPLEALWQREDLAAVFMCGLPFARRAPQPLPLAVPVPADPLFGGRPEYCSDLVVRADSGLRSLTDTFGGRLALTTRHSQSGYAALLCHLRELPALTGTLQPPYRELLEPQITPLGVLRAVVEGRADVAPLDAYAHALLRREYPQLTTAVRVVGRTALTPMPLLVASHPALGVLGEPLRAANRDSDCLPLMQELLLERFVTPQAADYRRLRSDCEAAERFWRARPLAATMHPAFAF